MERKLDAAKPAQLELDASRLWIPGILERIAAHLGPNEGAGLRLISRGAAELQAPYHPSKPVPHWVFDFWAADGACRCLNRRQREQLVSLTAASNDVRNLEVALEAVGLAPSLKHLKASASAGALDSCRWLAAPGRIQPGFNWRDVLIAAAMGGQLSVCEWVLEHAAGELDRGPALEAAVQAASEGHVRVMERLLEAAAGRADAQTRIVRAALRGCDLATALPYAQQAFWGEHELRLALWRALSSPTPDWEAKVEFLRARGAQLCPRLYAYAAHLPGPAALERFAWLRARGCIPTAAALRSACYEANLEAVRWLLQEGVRPAEAGAYRYLDTWSLGKVTGAGRLDILQSLNVEGLPYPIEPQKLAVAAAREGCQRVVEWAVEALGADPREPGILLCAVQSGDTGLVRWLTAKPRGCALTEGAWVEAAESGCEAMVDLLAELGCPQQVDGKPYLEAVRCHEWRLMPALRRAGLGFGPEPGRLHAMAARVGAPAATLEWLAEEGCPGLEPEA